MAGNKREARGGRRAKRNAETTAEAMNPIRRYEEAEAEESIDWEDALPRTIATSDDVCTAAQLILTRTLEGKLSTGQAQAATPLLALIGRTVAAQEDRKHKVELLRMQSDEGPTGLPPDPFVTRRVTTIATQEVEYGVPQRLPDPPMQPILSTRARPLFAPVGPKKEE